MSNESITIVDTVDSQNTAETVLIWVCQCCMLNHANGECGCGAYYGEDPDHDPLGLVDNSQITMGVLSDEHSCGDPDNVYDECDCETNTSSTSPCQGCGSWLHGERHAMTLWLN